jgi:amino acid permease
MVSRYKSFFTVAAILAAATVGDGVFALPYVFYTSGWLLGLIYLAFLAAIVIAAHAVYLRVLEGEDEKERLLGLAEKYFGKWGFGIGFFSIVAGLLLALVAILVLGAKFLMLLFPAAPGFLALIVFWMLVSTPLLLRDGRVVGLELVGIICTSAIIIFVFAVAWPHVSFSGTPAVSSANAFLPFGVILFALAGWTGIEPAYETRKKWNMKSSSVAALAAGTIFAAILYVLFVMGILGSGATVTPDTLSGLANWPAWERIALALLGFLAVWTVSMPISREVKNSLEKDLGWNPFVAKLLIMFVPLLSVLAGFNNFLLVVSLAGGLFISLQYLLMISVGRRALALARPQKFLMDTLALIFILAAVYEIYYFIVK